MSITVTQRLKLMSVRSNVLRNFRDQHSEHTCVLVLARTDSSSHHCREGQGLEACGCGWVAIPNHPGHCGGRGSRWKRRWACIGNGTILFLFSGGAKCWPQALGYRWGAGQSVQAKRSVPCRRCSLEGLSILVPVVWTWGRKTPAVGASAILSCVLGGAACCWAVVTSAILSWWQPPFCLGNIHHFVLVISAILSSPQCSAELGGGGEHLLVCKSTLLCIVVMSTVWCYYLFSFSHCFFPSKLLSPPTISAF